MDIEPAEPISLSKPIVYGSFAFWQGRQAELGESHRWICFLRSPRGEDLSRIIAKVQFVLDPSFKDPVRTVTSPPYEVREVGWGQFDITIRIFFTDPSIPPVEITHFLKVLILCSSMQTKTKCKPRTKSLSSQNFMTNLSS